jgi:hypothetical protein
MPDHLPDLARLHVTNGSAAAASLADSGVVEGEVIGFDEALVDGPKPVGGLAGKWQWRRSRHIAAVYGVPLEEAVARQQAVSGLVERLATGAEPVVFWFERDLFCQANLAGLLYRLHHNDLPTGAPIELVLADVGALRPGADWQALIDTRVPVTHDMLHEACVFWEAIGEPGRGPIGAALADPRAFHALPSLRRALEVELERRPVVHGGAIADPGHHDAGTPGRARIEDLVLDLLDGDEPTSFTDLFAAFSAEHARFGLGDLQFWNLLLTMAGAEPRSDDPGEGDHHEHDDDPPLIELAGVPLSVAAITEGGFRHATVAALD